MSQIELAQQTHNAQIERFRRVRRFSERLAEPLSPEDCAMQSMPDVSPTRWHLAHTTWFYETFLLSAWSEYKVFDPRFEALFNSYYNAVGPQFPRDRRGTISRPNLGETLDYRRYVDQHVEDLLQRESLSAEQLAILELGCQHEQQHQELMLTDIKHVLYSNPLYPEYCSPSSTKDGTPRSAVARDSVPPDSAPPDSVPPDWVDFDEQIVDVGAAGGQFCFDNELPRHRELVPARQIATGLVRNEEFLEFIADGGYRRPELWLSLGWTTVQQERWSGPLYWESDESGCTWQYRLDGRRVLNPHEPVCHVSYFEAEAFARWAGGRLPTEQEWEAAASSPSAVGKRDAGPFFADSLLASGRAPHPQIEHQGGCFLGNLWQWTSSHYSPYPGFRPAAGAIGEYNGKFMCNQFVLRGGSCATVSDHIRPSYRNFFPPSARWQFSGIRLAK